MKNKIYLEFECRNFVFITNIPKLRAASLDHSMWIHRPFRADDWLLSVCEGSVGEGGRALAFGKFFDRQGRLVVSTAQEAMLRWRKPASKL